MSQRISDITNRDIEPSSKIDLHEPDSNTSIIKLKPAGFSPALTFNIMFTTFWLGFVAFWSVGASLASIFFAMFSIPFWVVGFTMFYGIINTLFGRQEIEVRRGELIIHKKTPLFKKEKVITYKELDAIELAPFSARAKNLNSTIKMTSSGAPDNGFFSETPVIRYNGIKEELFAEHLSPRDKKWLVDYLNNRIVPLMKFIR